MTADVHEVAIGDVAIVAVREAVAGWRPGFQGRPDAPPIAIGFSCHLVTLGAACVLIDAGLGQLELPWARRFADAFSGFTAGTGLDAALATRGLGPDDVTHVVLTHAHLDHLAGTMVAAEDGALAPRFPNARHFLHPADRSTSRYDGRANPDGDAWLSVLSRHGLLEMLDLDGEVTSGIRVEHAPGESPGHRVVWIERGDDRLVHLGDLVHGLAELEQPAWVPAGRDPASLVSSRHRVLAEATRRAALVTFSHAADEPFGRLQARGDGYAWTPSRDG